MVRYFCQSLDPFLPRIRAIHPDITGSVLFEREPVSSVYFPLSLSLPLLTLGEYAIQAPVEFSSRKKKNFTFYPNETYWTDGQFLIEDTRIISISDTVIFFFFFSLE